MMTGAHAHVKTVSMGKGDTRKGWGEGGFL